LPLDVLSHTIGLLSPLCLIRPPLTPTPFPYTTLFRSGGRAPRTASARRRCRHRRKKRSRSSTAPARNSPGRTRSRTTLRRARRADRKSTRLNSSHVSISYAVFCLNKKKKKHKAQLLEA